MKPLQLHISLNGTKPEDCGGVYGYRDLLKETNTPIDPHEFNLDEANDALFA